jgi:ComF family protein
MLRVYWGDLFIYRPMLTQLLRQAAANSLPSQCAVCRSWGQSRVCTACAGRFAADVPRCVTCALAITGSAGQCGACMRQGSALDACYAAVDYTYPWNDLLSKFKFDGGSSLGGVSGADPAVAGVIATIMRQRSLIMQALAQADWALPVPLAAPRLAQRGFNQALEITKQLLNPSGTLRAVLRTDMLVRTRDTAPQVGLDRAQRQRNMLHAFAIEPAHAAQVSGTRVVLVDDVTTTTATLCAAAAALRAAGAAQVVALVFARTPEGERAA